MAIRNPWIFSVIGLLLTFLITGYSLHLQRQIAIDAALDELNEILVELRIEWSRTVVELEQTLTGFQNYLELSEQLPEPNPSGLRRTMDSLVLNNPYMVSLVVTDHTGQVLHFTNSGPKPNLSDRDYFKIHTTTVIDGISFGSPLPSIMSPGQWVFGASKAVRHPDRTLNKVLIAILDTSSLFRTLESERSDRNLTLTVFSQGGDVYARTPALNGIIGSQHPELLNTRQFSNIVDNRSAIININGKKYLMLLYHLDCCQLYFHGEVPLADTFEPWGEKTLMIAATGGMIALVLVWQLIRLMLLSKRERQLSDQLPQISRQDPLTGLSLLVLEPNKKTEDVGYQPAATLVIISPDNFAEALERFGEQATDALIVHFAHALGKLIPHSAHLYRGPGSSFFLLLPVAKREQALITVETLRKKLAAESCHFEGNGIELIPSAGITLWDGLHSNLSAAMQRAVVSLSRARQNGGNQSNWLPAREVWLEKKQW